MRKVVVVLLTLIVLNIVMSGVIFAAECKNAKENPCSYDYENYLTDSYNGRFENNYTDDNT